MLTRRRSYGENGNMMNEYEYSIEYDEKAWFFTFWYRLMKNRSWFKNIGVGMVKNERDYSVLRTLAVCQGKMNK